MLRQFKNPILVKYDNLTSLSDIESAVNTAISSNAAFCLVDNLTPSGENFFVLDEEWGIPNPIHSVVLVEITEAMDTQLPTALSNNPDYRLVTICGFSEVPAFAFVLGKS